MLSTFNMYIITELTFREAVFLLPLRPWGGGVLLHGWAGSTRGSQKVTCFAVFLELQGVGDKRDT